MKRKIVAVALVLFLVVGIVAVFAIPGKTNCTYALPGMGYQMKFWVVGSSVDLTANGQFYRNAGNFRVSGDRVTVTFKNDMEGPLAGVTFVLTILSNGDLDGRDGTWVEI
ncbi:MAG: hypothetical protein LBJ31_05890 [Treponema sp.]|jgi:hypothetical protein|nr:hypothetical protein [Treponema sp.]